MSTINSGSISVTVSLLVSWTETKKRPRSLMSITRNCTSILWKSPGSWERNWAMKGKWHMRYLVLIVLTHTLSTSLLDGWITGPWVDSSAFFLHHIWYAGDRQVLLLSSRNSVGGNASLLKAVGAKALIADAKSRKTAEAALEDIPIRLLDIINPEDIAIDIELPQGPIKVEPVSQEVFEQVPLYLHSSGTSGGFLREISYPTSNQIFSDRPPQADPSISRTYPDRYHSYQDQRQLCRCTSLCSSPHFPCAFILVES